MTVQLQTQSPSSDNLPKTVRIGLLGCGTVGSGVIKLLSRHDWIQVVQIAVRDTEKARDLAPEYQTLLTADVNAVVDNPNVDVVIEVMGGKEFPKEIIARAIANGKHVVTANKVVIAHYGPELFALAAKHQVNLLFEASVAGGIPIVMPLKTSLAANRIQRIAGILNGTTNYILTRMEQARLSFEVALKEAQDKGFAEADPTADVEGHDAACKIAILGSIAYQGWLPQTSVYMEGISKLGALDIDMAETLGFAIRLIAMAQVTETGAIDVRVHPMLVPKSHPLAKVTFENNAIWVQGDAVGDVMFYGKGAGELPTASAVSADTLLIGHAIRAGLNVIPGLQLNNIQQDASLYPMAQTHNAYYVRLEAYDKPGVIGMIGKACGDHGISIESIMQKETNPVDGTAYIVLLTHSVQEASMQAALKDMAENVATKCIHTVLRVFPS